MRWKQFDVLYIIALCTEHLFMRLKSSKVHKDGLYLLHETIHWVLY